MNTMIKIAAAGTFLFLAACGKESLDADPDPKPVVEPTLTIAPVMETVSFGADPTESYSFQVTTNQTEWEAVSDQEWCKIAIDAQAGTFSVSAQPNESTVPPPPATITVTAGKAAPLTITATQAAAEYNIYLAGTIQKENGIQISCFWKNGQRTELSDGTKQNECTAITASEGSFYISGREEFVPCYWKDGQRFDLVARNYSAAGIAVENGSVYVLSTNFYWQGSDTTVPLENYDLSTEAIAVSDGTVYIAGTNVDDKGIFAACWSDGRTDLLALPNGGADISRANCAAASEGSVYIGGSYAIDMQIYPAYWKDGNCVTLELPQGGAYCEVEAICVQKGKVYAVGSYTNPDDRACYWADGTLKPLELPEDDGFYNLSVTGIATAGESVYVSGNYGIEGHSYSCYWIDGKRTDLVMEEGVKASRVNGIALIKK